MTRVGLLLVCVLAFGACFEPRKVSLGTFPTSGQGAAGMMSEMDENEQENDDIDDPESGDSPGEDDDSR
jgi:hypothetical protein